MSKEYTNSIGSYDDGRSDDVLGLNILVLVQYIIFMNCMVVYSSIESLTLFSGSDYRD